ncbi:alpha/beta fold hydrolase [Thiovibrio sp. JS02]
MPWRTLPCPVIWGSEDTVSPPANAEPLSRKIAGCRKHVIEGAPHPCHLAEPRDWHDAFLGFLKQEF